MGHGAHHIDVVGDEHVTQAMLALQVTQQLQNLLLDRYVERAGRLVQHDDFRPDHERARDGNPLPLTSRELMGIAPEERLDQAVLRQSDFLQGLDDALAPPVRTKAGRVDLEAFADDRLDGQARR